MKETLIAILLTISINVFAPVVSGDIRRNMIEETKLRIEQEERRLYIESFRDSSFTKENFLEYLRLTTDNAEIAYQQAVLETGWFEHIRCTKYNNYFGMKKAKVREHCQAGEWSNHATYDHWTYSVDDYVLWQEYWSQYYDQTDYYKFLGDVGYATASRYVQVLKQIPIS